MEEESYYEKRRDERRRLFYALSLLWMVMVVIVLLSYLVYRNTQQAPRSEAALRQLQGSVSALEEETAGVKSALSRIEASLTGELPVEFDRGKLPNLVGKIVDDVYDKAGKAQLGREELKQKLVTELHVHWGEGDSGLLTFLATGADLMTWFNTLFGDSQPAAACDDIGDDLKQWLEQEMPGWCRHEQPVQEARLQSSILFDHASSRLTQSGEQEVLAVAGRIKNLGIRRVRITGYADKTGASDYNRRLSQARADAVAAKLREYRLPERVTITPIGSGEAEIPVLTADSISEPLNRSALIVLEH